MKICHVNLASGYHGGENQTLQLIKQQLKMGYHLTVVAKPKSPFAQAVSDLGCQCYFTRHFLIGHQRTITADCQVIHVHEGRAIYWAYLQNLIFGIPYVVTRRIDNALKKKGLSNLAYQRSAALVGLSHKIVSCLRQAYPEKPIVLIPSSPVCYSYDAQKVADIQRRFHHRYLVIHAANMLEHKGFDVTIKAARQLQGQAPEVHFILLGDGKIRSELEQQALGLTNISFVGKQHDMGNWFKAANMLVHPAYSEGLGSVILEALAAKLPVVASRAGGIPDIIDHNQSGLLIEPGNPIQLAESIVRIKCDPRLQQQLQEGAERKLSSFNISYAAEQYQALYWSLVD
jgi:L-malate glycosyltransferase